MSKHTVDLINETTNKKYNSKGFLFKYDGGTYIISVHHWMPIINTYLKIDKAIFKLNKIKNIYWNELNIFELNINKTIIKHYIQLKAYKTRFPEFKSEVKIEINNKFEKYLVYDYEYIQDECSMLESIYLKFFISKNKNDVNKYVGLSGSPIYNNDNILLGIFTQICVENDERVVGLFLPMVYIIKSLQRKDNEHIYKLDISYDTNLKIGNYEIQKHVDSLHNYEKDNYVIYHFTTNFKLKLNAFLNLEGDIDKNVIIKNNKTNEIRTINYEKYEDFDININILKNEENKFKINNGFTTLLCKNNLDNKVDEINKKFNNKKDLWLSLEDIGISLSQLTII